MPTRRRLVFPGLPVVLAALGTIGLGVALGDFSQDSDSKPVVYNTSQDATAKCPPKQHVSFGGFKVDTTVPFGGLRGYTWPQSMGPKGSDTDKWSVAAENSGSAKDGKVSSYAYCQGGAEPKVVRKSQLVLPSAANDEFRSVEVGCPGSKNVIGGGWAAVTPQLNKQHTVDIMGLQRTSDHTWEVSVINDSGVQQKVTAIALCGKGNAPKTVTATEHIPNNPTATKDAVATCPHGTEARFGGFKGDYDRLSGRNAFIFSFALHGDGAIKVHGGQNYDGVNTESSTLKAFAYCK
jgi:hypothetical protein